MTRKEMTNERAQSDVRINSAERGGIGRSQIESLFKTHYTQMYHLALTLLFDEAESKDVVSDVFASLLSGKGWHQLCRAGAGSTEGQGSDESRQRKSIPLGECASSLSECAAAQTGARTLCTPAYRGC